MIAATDSTAKSSPRQNAKDKHQDMWAGNMLQQPRSSLHTPCPSVFQRKRKNHQPAPPACCSVTYKRRTPSLGAGASVTTSFKKKIWTIKKFLHPVLKTLPGQIFGLASSKPRSKPACTRGEACRGSVKQRSQQAPCDWCCRRTALLAQGNRRKTCKMPSEEQRKGSMNIEKAA